MLIDARVWRWYRIGWKMRMAQPDNGCESESVAWTSVVANFVHSMQQIGSFVYLQVAVESREEQQQHVQAQRVGK